MQKKKKTQSVWSKVAIVLTMGLIDETALITLLTLHAALLYVMIFSTSELRESRHSVVSIGKMTGVILTDT